MGSHYNFLKLLLIVLFCAYSAFNPHNAQLIKNIKTFLKNETTWKSLIAQHYIEGKDIIKRRAMNG